MNGDLELGAHHTFDRVRQNLSVSPKHPIVKQAKYSTSIITEAAYHWKL